ncbi:MAG: TIM barrel protein [Phycisphaerales bacterium]|jgi:sugar phosphate isomerase/epimerase|nr:TIM barrel protein [Phycisphaerales bacterium]
MMLINHLTAARVKALAKKGKGGGLTLLELPKFTRQQLGLHGLSITTDVLKGQSREQLAALRDRADKAGCACLLLVEQEAQRFGDDADEVGFAAIERTQRIIDAASVLGCNAAALPVAAGTDEMSIDLTIERLRHVVEHAERKEMNLLLVPHAGLTSDPDRVTDLIKKVGGFRLGTFPDFEVASKQDDPVSYIKRLTPYASAVCAATLGFVAKEDEDDLVDLDPPEHEGYALEPLVAAVLAVGFDGTLAVDYRGVGDGTLGTMRSVAALEAALDSALPGGPE